MSKQALHFRHSRALRTNRWSQEELRRLRELAEQGVSLNRIATLLNRSQSAIRNKAGMQGLSLRTQITHLRELASKPTPEQLSSTCAILHGAKGTVC